MKSEVGSFTPSTAGNTIFLDDDTLQIVSVLFQISKNGTNVNGSTGFDDSIKRRGKYCLDDTIKGSDRSTTYSMYHRKNVSGTLTDAVRGKVVTNGFVTPGQFEMSFDTADTAYTVDFIVFGS